VHTAMASVNGLWFMRSLIASSTVKVRMQFRGFVQGLTGQA
jgi:hypothetical protein